MSEFLEIIEYTDQGEQEIVHRVPAQGSAAIKFGAFTIQVRQPLLFLNTLVGLEAAV